VDYITQDKLIDYHPLGKHNGFGQNVSSYFVVLCYRVECYILLEWLIIQYKCKFKNLATIYLY
jgi:hypothetical protein